jgi:hypothetical protein
MHLACQIIEVETARRLPRSTRIRSTVIAAAETRLFAIVWHP